MNPVHRFVDVIVQALRQRVARWTQPASAALVQGLDLARNKPEPVAEHLLLRQQLSILNRIGTRSVFTRRDRALLVLLAR